MPTNYARFTKHASTAVATVGMTVTYTFIIENTHHRPFTDMMFHDPIPQGLAFHTGSVTIDGVPHDTADPRQGFSVPSIMTGNSREITFTAEVTLVPADNPAINIAEIDFRTISEDDEPILARESSNPISIAIMACGCEQGSCDKSICKQYALALPFSVKPFVKNERPDIICIGELMLSEGHHPCPTPQHDFDYTVTQHIKVELPLTFGATVCYEEPCTQDLGECTAN